MVPRRIACLHVPPEMRNWSQRVPHCEQGGGVVLVTDVALTSRDSHSSHIRNCSRKGEGSSSAAPSRYPPLHDSTHYSAHRMVHSCQQKSIGLKFSKSQTGSDVRYCCHHNSSRFTFPIFAHSCRFSVLHSLQSITLRIY